ncbi:hypothetical protein HWV62_22096 [Athelia sp. TMB]|nr:hypothetical protein HWV62_22096 [Athelia sp. TMB]
MDFNLQSLSLDDTLVAAAAASASSVQWKLDPDFTAQIDRVGRLLVVEDITDAILEISGLLEIFSVRRTCRLGRRAVDNYNSRAFNVNRNLLRFFDDPVSFRSLQERTDTLISGSFALALLDRTIYPDSDLDLYTHPGFAPEVSEWMYVEGYRLVRRDINGKITDDTTGFSLNWRDTVIDNWQGLQPPYGSLPGFGAHSESVLYDGMSLDIHDVYTWQKSRKGHVETVDVISCKRCPLATASQIPSIFIQFGAYTSQATLVHREMDFNFQSLSLKDRDSTFNNGTSSVIETQWQLDPDFTAQKDSVGRLLVVEDITDAILAASGLLEIFSFRRTCRLGRRATDSYTARAFSVNRSLLRFFDKPESFRSLQERTSTLISGSFALAVLDRTIYPDSDLDLYTHPGYAPNVAEWLSQEGYRLVRRHVAADGGAGGSGTKSHVELDWREKVVDNWRGITQLGILEPEDDVPFLEPYEHLSEMHAVYTWHKCKDDQVRVVQVMSCKTCPLACILTFHSTVVQNVISHRASYALYPKATFVSRIGVPLEAVNDRHARALEKYKDRGWTINADFMRDRIQEFQPQQKRRVGDAYSWCLPDLPRTGTSTSQENFPDPVAANSFVLTYDKLEMKCLVLSSPILRLQYMIAEEVSQEIVQSLDWHWRRHRRRLEQLPLEEREGHMAARKAYNNSFQTGGEPEF